MTELVDFLKSERGAAIVRLACMIATGILALVGVSLDFDVVVEGAACVLALACAVLCWWKNNNVTEAAATAQEVLELIKNGEGYQVTISGLDEEECAAIIAEMEGDEDDLED